MRAPSATRARFRGLCENMVVILPARSGTIEIVQATAKKLAEALGLNRRSWWQAKAALGINLHSAATTPGVVYVESGTWTEGRDSGETHYSAGDTFVEDNDTVHWFYNRGDEPAAAYVCDIKPAG